jgi:hypothetical protein
MFEYIMANTKRDNKRPAAAGEVITIRVDDDLRESLNAAVTTTKLSRSDLARMSMERGLKVLLAQLSAPVPPALAA